jgi:hypothetical protein
MFTLTSATIMALAVAEATAATPRVLLFTSAPTREYQFCRQFFLQEQERGRADLTICLQGVKPAATQDVPAERLLADFPERLDHYDVILAFDPDWSRLAAAQRKTLAAWSKDGGGLVLVAGPLFARQLLDPSLALIAELYPVVVAAATESSSSLPWRLRFHEKERPTFLKLDVSGADELAGWVGFFGETGKPPPPEPDLKRVEALAKQLDSNDFEVRQAAQLELVKQGRAGIRVLEKLLRDQPPLEVRMRAEQVLAELRRGEERRGGFYACHPVKEIKATAVVLATFTDPDRRHAGKDCPFLASMAYGKGRIVYLGSGEMWRLRQYRVEYYEQFWRELVKYAAE